MFKKIIMVALVASLPLTTHAFGLTYRLTNLSHSVVTFSSTDWLDWGTRVYQGQKKESWYLFSPKNMFLKMHNSDSSRFTLLTTTGCDLLGLPSFRQPSPLMTQLKGHPVRMGSGMINVVISDLPDSSLWNKKISCSIVASD